MTQFITPQIGPFAGRTLEVLEVNSWIVTTLWYTVLLPNGKRGMFQESEVRVEADAGEKEMRNG